MKVKYQQKKLSDTIQGSLFAFIILLMKTRNNISKNNIDWQKQSQQRLLNPLKQLEYNCPRLVDKNFAFQEEIREFQFDRFLQRSLPIPTQQNYAQLQQDSFNSFFKKQLKVQQYSYGTNKQFQSGEKAQLNENKLENSLELNQENQREPTSFEDIGRELFKLFKEKNRNVGTMKKLAKYLSLIIVEYFEAQFHHKQLLNIMFELMGFKLSTDSTKKKFKQFFGRRVVDILNVLQGAGFLKKKGKYYQLNINSQVAKKLTRQKYILNKINSSVLVKKQQNTKKRQMISRMKFYCRSIQSKSSVVKHMRQILKHKQLQNCQKASQTYCLLAEDFEMGYNLSQNMDSREQNNLDIISDFQVTHRLLLNYLQKQPNLHK